MNKFSFFVDLIIVSLIYLVVNFYFNYEFGDSLLTGDFRPHHFVADELSKSLFNTRLMNENLPFISLHSVNFLISKISNYFFVIFVIFIIPILSYLSFKYSVLGIFKVIDRDVKEFKPILIFISSFALIYSLNSSYFNRIGHWNINYLTIIIPIFFYCVFSYLKFGINVKNSIMLFGPLTYFGVSSPHSFLLLLFIVISIALYYLIVSDLPKKDLFKRIAILLLIFTLFTFHIFLPMFLKKELVVRSSWEGETTSGVLNFLSKNSDLFTSLSGTNYYYDELIKYLLNFEFGFVILILFIFVIFKKNKFDKFDLFLLINIFTFLIVNIGYKNLNFLFNIFLYFDFIRNIMWVIKDPNMFYNILNFYYFIFLIKNYDYFKFKKSIDLYFISFVIIFLNITNLIFSDINEYRNFYNLVKVPNEYLEVKKYLEENEYLTLWVPSSVYDSKNFSKSIKYFPNPNLWLTVNREVSVSNIEYSNLIREFNNEVIEKKCLNKDYISWLISSNKINLVVDLNSKSSNINVFKECIESIKSFEVEKKFGNLVIYKNNNLISSEIYSLEGSKEVIIKHINSNPNSNYIINQNNSVIFTKQKVEDNLEVIPVPYNPNLIYQNQPLKGPINISSSTVIPTSGFFEIKGLFYQGSNIFDAYLLVQKVFLFIFISMLMYYNTLYKYGARKHKV